MKKCLSKVVECRVIDFYDDEGREAYPCFICAICHGEDMKQIELTFLTQIGNIEVKSVGYCCPKCHENCPTCFTPLCFTQIEHLSGAAGVKP